MAVSEIESIAKNQAEEKLLGVFEQALQPLGFRVVDLDCRLSGRSLVRVFIDKIEKQSVEGNVSLTDCRQANDVLGPVIEKEENLFPGGYDLEISSPGLDRRLRLKQDFASVVGQEVKLKLNHSIEGVGANVRGVLEGLSEEGIRVRSSGKEIVLRLGDISQANRVWQFKQ